MSLWLCFSRSRKSDVPSESKGEFHSVGFEKAAVAGRRDIDSGSIEEMPLAYKDIDRVMYTQETLVEVQVDLCLASYE